LISSSLDSSFNPAGCYGLTPTQMVAWIKDFSDTYHSMTTR
jgi:hypothetical protein